MVLLQQESQINPIYENDSQFEHEVIVQSDSIDRRLSSN
jgi:hypothetical protein